MTCFRLNDDRWWEQPLAQFRTTLTYYPSELRSQILASNAGAQRHLSSGGGGTFETPADVRARVLQARAESDGALRLFVDLTSRLRS